MNIKENKPLLILIITIIILSVTTLVLYLSMQIKSNKEEEKQKTQTEEKTYKMIEDTKEEILKKVYNENIWFYADGYNYGVVTENIFGNENEKPKELYSQQYKMSLALYNFDIPNLKTIKCDEIGFTEDQNGYKCGGAGENLAYVLPVQDLNNKVVEIFDEDLDYSQLDTDNLYIGTCKGNKNIALPFKYIKDQSIYISTISKEVCQPSKSFEITEVIKTQDKELLTLDVYYTVKELTSTKKHDKLYFQVKEDGSYHFKGSIMVENDIKN